MPQGETKPSDARAQAAIDLAQKWVLAESAPDGAAALLAGVLKDAGGLPFTLGFVDGVMRPESLAAAASSFSRLAPLVPHFLPWYLRSAVRIGAGTAPLLPAPVVPIARKVLREMVGHLILDARPTRLGPALEKLRATGQRLNLNLLGEAVLGDTEAQRRLSGIHELIRRPDVDYVSVKVSSVVSHVSLWAFDDLVADVVARLTPLYITAAGNGTFVNLDMEEYRDLDLTIAVFTHILEDSRLRDYEGGIVLQTYLPDSRAALQEITAWARERVDHGGARINVRLVKGANLAMERVDAIIHGWPQAPYLHKVDTDANYLRCLDDALRPESSAAVRVGIAGHNLFDIAWAWLLAGEREVRGDIEFEMLLGMAQEQVSAVSADVGTVLLYVPLVAPAEFDVAISYLARRLEETASPANFLSVAFELRDHPELFDREARRFLASVARSTDPTLASTPRRTQDRLSPVHESAALPSLAVEPDETKLTNAVLGIGTDSDEFTDTAVFATYERAKEAKGAPGFANTPDTDPSLSANREWAKGVFDRMVGSDRGVATLRASAVSDAADIDRLLARVRNAGAVWGARPAADRSEVLLRAAAAIEAHRGDLIETAASETGKVFAEADSEVSEAVDFARYYAAKARELDSVPGARFVPAQVTLVTPSWNFPVAIAAGGVLAALAAGSGAVVKPSPQAGRCAAVLSDALWEAGISRDLLVLVDVDEDGLGRELISHPDVDRVILTGSWETAELFRSWRPDLPLLAETSGKNAIVVMPSADMDMAAADVVRSAFGHAGQKCSAASLVILVGSVARSKRFARQLVDATTSLSVAWPTDPASEVGPLIGRPEGNLEWALTELGTDERWIVKPRLADGDETGRLWHPGIRAGVRPGSRFHQEEIFGPVLGVMEAATLTRAIELQNDVPFGLTAGLHTQDPDDLEAWLRTVEAGNLYVNRSTTGAIVQRQPFGGWKRSAVGPGAKAGGPNYLVSLGKWRGQSGSTSSTLHLRGLDSRITALIEAAQPTLDFEAFEWLRRSALSDALAWDREFGQVRDVSRLAVERNLFRYRAVPVMIRATPDAQWQHVLRAVVAAIRAGAKFVLSVPTGLPVLVRSALADVGAFVAVETDEDWLDRMSATAPDGTAPSNEQWAMPDRVRLVGGEASVSAIRERLLGATGGTLNLTVYDGEVTTAARIELLPFLREQAISITAHRFGNPDDWSAAAI